MGSPTPRTGISGCTTSGASPGPGGGGLRDSTNALHAGMIRAGFFPISAMSTKQTASASAPSSACSARIFGALTATITG